MKFLLYLAGAFVVFGIIKHILKSKNENIGNKMKTTVLVDGKPFKPPKDYDEQKRKRDEQFLRVDPNEKNDGLNLDTDELVAWSGNRKIYKTPDGKWFIVNFLRKGERSYQRMTPWEVRNFIKHEGLGRNQDSAALLEKHNLTGTKAELHDVDIPRFVARKYITPNQQGGE